MNESAVGPVATNARAKYGIYPYQWRRRLWEWVVYLCAVACVWEMPFEWLLNFERPWYYVLPSLLLDAVFLADVFIVTRTGVLEYGIISVDKDTIRKHMKKWRLIVYWLSPWPYYLIGWATGNDIAFRVLVSLKLLRVVRLWDAHRTIRNTLVYINTFSHMFVLLIVFLTVTHYCACIFWFVGFVDKTEKSWLRRERLTHKDKMEQYLYSAYYITTTILTIGYGDIHPYTFPEVLTVVLIEIIGVFIYNYMVSVMVSIVADPARNTFLTKIRSIEAAFRNRGLAQDPMDEMLKYYQYVWERDRTREQFYESVSRLPDELQKRLERTVHMEMFMRATEFTGMETEALEKLALCLRPRIFSPGDYLTKAGRVNKRIYFLIEGRLNVYSSVGSYVGSITGDDKSVLGETSIVYGRAEQATAIADTLIDTYELRKEDYDSVILCCRESQPVIQMMVPQ